jgi:hypothetical protein
MDHERLIAIEKAAAAIEEVKIICGFYSYVDWQ